MRICFVVNSVRTQRPTYTTAHLAYAAHRRGHDVAFVSVEHLSHDGAHVWGTLSAARGERLKTPVNYVKELRADGTRAPERPGRLRRGLSPQQPQRGRAGRRRLQPGHRVRPAAEDKWGDGVQRPRRPGAGRVEDVPGRISRGDSPADADHPVSGAGAGVPARTGRAGHHQAAARLRRAERVLRRPGGTGEPAQIDLRP
jgi:hypothetical protein